MSIIAITIALLASLVGLVWSSRHYLIWKEQHSSEALTESSPGPPANAPLISVVVAAKDEAENIESCVRTMLDQDYPDFELIVCNDRSTDDTAAIVERMAATESRLRLINIDHLPDGWCGKNNAMQQGIATASGNWICMIDADCRQISRRTLSVAMQQALDNEADLLSLLPVMDMRGFWENVIQPVCVGIMMIWFQPDHVNNPRKTNAYANGAFMLMKRSAYEAVGTHEAVKDRVNEDMHLATLVKSNGLRLRVIRSRGLNMVRMYTSFLQALRGWSRIFFGTFGTLKRLTVSLLVLTLMGLLPYAAVVIGLSAAAVGAKPEVWWWTCGILGIASVAIQISVIYRYYKLIGARKELAWTYPIGCGIAIVTLLMALSKLRPGAEVTWRNTSYSKPAS